MNLRKPLLAVGLLLSPALAFAHPGHDHMGVLSGFAHPIFASTTFWPCSRPASGPHSSKALLAGRYR